VGALALVTLALLVGCKERPNDYKGRPIPDRSIQCRDGKSVKDVGPWACDEHGGRPEVPR
jgi:hypothetical protein